MTKEKAAAKPKQESVAAGGRSGGWGGSAFLAVHYVSGAFVVLMTVVTVVHALGRYLFARPVPGMVEMCTFMLVPIIFLAAPYTELQDGHTVIPLILDLMPPKLRAASKALMYILYFALAVLAAWQAWVRAGVVRRAGYVSTVLGIPHYPFVIMVAVGWVLLALTVLARLREYLRSMRE
ncbi:TRAP transporter small permease [Moorellaceae bacterium AZ2]